jgi:hypothetical protein
MISRIKIITLLAIILGLICANTRAKSFYVKKNHILKKGSVISLFDGRSLKGWHVFNKKNIEVKNWQVENGALVCLGFKGPSGAGDIVSDRTFENFELTWDWKVDKGCNSGVFYHIVEGPKYKRASETSPEYQIIDDIGFPSKLEGWQKTGADYAMHEPNDIKKKLNPIGEWNSSRILFKNGHVEHWLNGQKIVEFQAWTPEWHKKRMEGKWKDFPDYGMSKTGSIGFQDYGNKAYFKNIRIKEL